MAIQDTIDVVVNVVDNATEALDNIANGINNMGRTMGQALTGGPFAELGRGLTILGNGLSRTSQLFDPFTNAVERSLEFCGSRVTNFVEDSIKSFTEFSKASGEALAPIYAEYGFTDIANEYASKQVAWAKQNAYDTFTSTSEGITLVGELDKTLDASLSSEMVDSGAMTYISKFMKANNLSADDTAKVVAQGMNQFGYNTSNISDFLDKIQTSADISLASVQSIVEGLKYGGPIASIFGGKNQQSAEDYLAFAAYSADLGYDSTMGGTSFRRLMTNTATSELKLSQLSKTKKSGLEEMGLLDDYQNIIDQFATTSGGSTNIKDVIGLGDYIDNMSLTDNEKMALMYSIWGMQGLNAGSFSMEEYNPYLEKVQSGKGSVDTKYEAMGEETGYKWESLKTTWEATKIDFGQKLSPVMSEVISQAEDFIESGFDFSRFNPQKIRESLDKVVEAFDQDETWSGLSPLIRRFADGFSNLFEYGVEAIPQLLPKIEDMVDNILEITEDIGNGDTEEAFSKARELISKFYNLFEGLEFSNEDLEGINNIFSGITKLGTIGKGLDISSDVVYGLSTVALIINLLSGLGNGIGTLITGGAGAGTAGAGGAGTAGAGGAGAGGLLTTGVGGAVAVIGTLIGSLALLSQAIKYVYDKINGEGSWDKLDHTGTNYWDQDYYKKQEEDKREREVDKAIEEDRLGIKGDSTIHYDKNGKAHGGSSSSITGSKDTKSDYSLPELKVDNIGVNQKLRERRESGDNDDKPRQLIRQTSDKDEQVNRALRIARGQEDPLPASQWFKMPDFSGIMDNIKGAVSSIGTGIKGLGKSNNNSGGTTSPTSSVTTQLNNQTQVDNQLNINPNLNAQLSASIPITNNITVQESATVQQLVQQVASLQGQINSVRSMSRLNASSSSTSKETKP